MTRQDAGTLATVLQQQALPSPPNTTTQAQSITTQAQPSSLLSQWFQDSGTNLEAETSAPETIPSLHHVPQQSPSGPIILPVGPTPSPQSDQLAPWADDEQLVNLYYLNFHSSHPILLPRSWYWKNQYPRYLKAVVQLIGGHFCPTASRDSLRERVEQELDHVGQETPERVQAQLLYAVYLFAQHHSRQGQQVLDSAIESALNLGMHRQEFAAAHAGSLTVLEESMRRTWYELYVTDGCVAALQRKSTFKTNTVTARVLLPCDDIIYEDGMCFMPATLDDFHDNVFADEEHVFSSFCYRIEAVRLLGRVLTITGTQGVHRDLVQAADNALAAFIHHLPRSKSEAEIVSTFGEVDELMFQTHTIIQYSTILLHFPRGDLVSLDPLSQHVPGANNTKLLCPCNRQHVHSIKAIEASKTISMLAALRAPVQRHSPFFVYPLALAAVVQLAIGAIHAKSLSGCLEQHSDKIKLMLGVLKTMGRHWAAAESVLRVVKKMACAVFRDGRRAAESSPALRRDEAMDNCVDVCPQILPHGEWLDTVHVLQLSELMGHDNAWLGDYVSHFS
ncbi:c6 transcription factor [Pyrenophora seminiperda CCB06]|uniref:C6 transcription factor n=1 Tax=Pyrenophora seminiperda CCB06 TaxID=1302712 RepID=A0A3M7M461_9PLEO|nr:c6 transcription factor [Pyrenophora seminiperda CCB06]